MAQDELQQSLTAAISSRAEEAAQLLSELVAINSVNPSFPGVDRAAVLGGESKCTEFLEPRFSAAGCEATWVAKDPQRKNLVAVRRGTGGGRSLILNGHVDTVPPVDPENWLSGDPWKPEIRDGRLYGLGSTDMKAGIVALWLVARALEDVDASLAGDLIIQCVVGEETWEHELGTSACLEAGFRADGAIVVEPTNLPEPLSIAVVSAGLWALKIIVHGKSTHAGNRPLAIRPGGPGDEIGVNALEKGIKVVRALQELEIQWGMTKNHPLFPPGFFNLMPGNFYSDAGYPVPYYFPDRAEIQYDVWHDPRETGEECAREIEAFVGAMCQMDTWLREHPPEFEWMRYYPPLKTAWDHPLTQTLVKAHEAGSGTTVPSPSPAHPVNFAAAMDGTWIQEAGIPAICFGPGDVRIAHGKDEFVCIDEMIAAATSLAFAAVDWCRVAPRS
jgi:acetylornithine deacetylase/succinyl-diaminopimelate desuccinylase family protein